MSKPKLTKEQQIFAIMDILGVHDHHHDHIREHLEMLSDHVIQRQYDHCLVVKAFKEQQDAEVPVNDA